MSDDQGKSGIDRALEALKRAQGTRHEAEDLRPKTRAVAADAFREQRKNGLGDLMLMAMASKGET